MRLALVSLTAMALLAAACGASNGDEPPIDATTSAPANEASTVTPVPEATATVVPPATAAPDSGAARRTRLAPTHADVTYCTAGGVALKLKIYAPANAVAASPAILYVHGGGWTSGSKTTGTGSEMIPALVNAGFVVAAVDYRLAPKYPFPAQIEDVKCAVRYLRSNAALYTIDPARIGAYGGSAGGHLVALLGVTDGDDGFEGDGGFAGVSSRVQAVVDMFGPADLTVSFNGGDSTMSPVFGVTSRPSAVLAAASPVTHVSAGDPPFLILHGENDRLVPLSQSQELYDRLREAGVAATLTVVENAGHGFAPDGGAISPTRTEIARQVVEFFQRTLD